MVEAGPESIIIFKKNNFSWSLVSLNYGLGVNFRASEEGDSAIPATLMHVFD